MADTIVVIYGVKIARKGREGPESGLPLKFGFTLK